MVAARDRRIFGWREITASLIVVAVYSFCLYRMPTHTFWSPDEGSKFMQTKTIRWNGGIDYVLPYSAQAIDPETNFYAGHMWGERERAGLYPLQRLDGTFRFHWPIWFSLMAAVPVAFLGPTGGFLVAMLAGWLVAMLSGVLAGEIDRRLAAPAILVVGLATPIWFFSLCYWEHTSGVAFALLAILVLVRGHAELRALLIALPLAAAAVMMRIELVALVAALCVTFVVVGLQRAASARSQAGAAVSRRTRSRLVVTLVLIALAVVLVAVVQFTLTDRHAMLLGSLPSRLARVQYIPTLLSMLAVAPYWGEDGWPPYTDWRLGMAAVICCLLAPFMRPRWLQAPLAIAGLAGFAVYSGQLAMSAKHYRALHSLLPIAPFMILATHGVRYALQQRGSRFFVFAVAVVAYTVFSVLAMVMSYVDDAGQIGNLGLAWGQRYLLTLYPLLSVLSLAGVQGFWRAAHYRVSKLAVVGLATALILFGVKFELRGYDESRGTRQTLAAWQKAMEGKGPIVTDVWWLPAGVAEFYVRGPAFAVGWRKRTGDWVRAASDKGAHTFTFASLSPVRARDFGDPPPRNIVRRSVRVVRGLYLTKFSFLAGPRRMPAPLSDPADLASPPAGD